MSIESELFEKLRAVPEKLLAYGFHKEDSGYVYQASLAGGMEAQIHVRGREVRGRVLDEFDDEYIAFRLPVRGGFAAGVREEYLELLNDIADACFISVPFVGEQTCRIADLIQETYGVLPDAAFKKFPDYRVFRHEDGSWFALVMNVERAKLGIGSGMAEIIDLKCTREKDPEKGILPPYHMSGSGWLSVLLDDQLPDEEIMKMIAESHQLTDKGRIEAGEGLWLIPANPSYFDLDHAFSVSDTLYWHRSAGIKKGDTVFIYYGAPYSSIRYRCVVIETGFTLDDLYGIHKEGMRLQKVASYKDCRISMNVLREHGVRGVRGARRMPEELKSRIERMYPWYNNQQK